MAPPTNAPPAKAAPAIPNNFADLPTAAKVFIPAVLCTLLAAAYYFLVHADLAEEIERAERRHGELVTERAEAVRRQQEFVRVSQQLVEREPIDRRNRRILPEQAEMAALLSDFNRLAELSGLTIKVVRPLPELSESQYRRLPVNIEIDGQFHGVAKFLNGVTQIERIVSFRLDKVASISRRRRTRAPSTQGIPVIEEVIVHVELEASAYRRPPVAASPTEEGAGRRRGRRSRSRSNSRSGGGGH